MAKKKATSKPISCFYGVKG